MIPHTLSPSWSGALPIYHPRGAPQSHKVTKTTIKITRSLLLIYIMGKEENSSHEAIKP